MRNVLKHIFPALTAVVLSACTARTEAERALEYAASLDRNFIDTTDTGVIMPAVEYFRRHGSADERLASLYYLGRICENAGDNTAAVLHFTEALPLLETATDEKCCGMLCRQYAVHMNNFYLYDEAVSYYDKAIAFFDRFGAPTYAQECLYLKGEALIGKKSFAEASKIFTHLAATADEEITVSNSESSLGFLNTVAAPCDCGAALEHFGKALSISGSLPNLSQLGAYAYANEVQGNHATADRLLDFIKQDTSRFARAQFHYWKSRVLKNRGDFESALEEKEKVTESQDSTIYLILGQSLTKAQRDFFEAKRAESEMRARNTRLTLLLVTSLLLLILGIMAGLHRRRIVRLKQERDRMAEIADMVGARLKEASAARQDDSARLRAAYTDLYRTQFNTLSALCEAYFMEKKNNSDRGKILKQVEELFKDINSDTNGQARFEKMIDRELDNAMSELRAEVPGLSETDCRFASCVFAGLDTMALLAIFGIPSKNAVYVRKNRIKTKIQDSDAPRKDYLAGLLG